MKVLIVHHIEEYFDEKTVEDSCSTWSMTAWLCKAITYFNGKHYDVVIYNAGCMAESEGLDTTQSEQAMETMLQNLGDKYFYECLSWGYEAKYLIEDDIIVFEDGTSCWPTPEWYYFLNQHRDEVNIEICGVFDTECVAELREFLYAVDLDYEEIGELID